MTVEQVEETKPLGVTLDCKLSWSRHIDLIVVKMGRGLSVIDAPTDQTQLTKHVLHAPVLSNLYYRPAIWSSAAKKDLEKLQLAQDRAAHIALHHTQKAGANSMHVSLSWLNSCFCEKY